MFKKLFKKTFLKVFSIFIHFVVVVHNNVESLHKARNIGYVRYF